MQVIPVAVLTFLAVIVVKAKGEAAIPSRRRQCGVPAIPPDVLLSDSEPNVIGGKTAVPHSWPWQAIIYFLFMQECGGSLINDEWVLTAAHCIATDPGDTWLYKVKLGAHWSGVGPLRNPFEWETQQTRAVKEMLAHPLYDANTHSYDVALFRLASKVKLTDYVSPVCLPSRHDRLADAEKVAVTGFGIDYAGALWGSWRLQEAVVPIVNQKECINDYASQPWRIDDSMLCAGYKQGGKDACQGDSGGPLVAHHNGRWIVEGTVSWGLGCATPGYPGVYGRVSVFADWIRNVTGLPI